MKRYRCKQVSRRYICGIFIFFCGLLCHGENFAEGRSLKALFLSPYPADFWDQTAGFAAEVAKDLNVEFESITTKRRLNTTREFKYALRRRKEERPDLIILQYQVDTTRFLIEEAEKRGVALAFINTDIPENERRFVARPREKYSNWYLHMFTDDEANGYQLADHLAMQYRKQHSTAVPIEIVGIGGAPVSSAGTMRNKGLERRVKSHQDLSLKRLVFTNWYKGESDFAVSELLKLFPNLALIWNASDYLGTGSLDAVERAGLEAGKDVLIGGIDGSEEGVELVKQGRFAVTLGGHYREAGWALLLMYDLFNGKDFSNSIGNEVSLPLTAIDQENVDEYELLLFGDKWKRIDFKRFSKVHNEDLEEYDFSFEKMLLEYKNLVEEESRH